MKQMPFHINFPLINRNLIDHFYPTGKKLWLAGAYHGKITPLRELNDRRAMNATLWLFQSSGLNTYHGHWDDLGRNWLEACDEKGVFVLGAFFCDGRPKIHSRGDAGWVPWITRICAEWVEARRHHPSILLWRPADVLPPHASDTMSNDQIWAALGDEVRRHDPSGRPLADNSECTDVVAWGQPPQNAKTGKLDNYAPLEEAAQKTKKPLLCKEIYGGFSDVPAMLQFFETYYTKSFELKSSGIIVQSLPLQAWREPAPYTVQWPSQSGSGNRDLPTAKLANESANWCDAAKPAWRQSEFAKAFAKWFPQFTKSELKPGVSGLSPELLATGLKPGSVAWLVPSETAACNPLGVLSAADGSAWFIVPRPGNWRLVHEQGEKTIEVRPLGDIPSPGYGQVLQVKAGD